MTTFTPAAGNHTSTSLEFQPFELLPGDRRGSECCS